MSQFVNGEYLTAEQIETLVTTLRAENARLVVHNSPLAANQCHDGYAGDHGHHRCREVDEAWSNGFLCGWDSACNGDDETHERILAIKYANAVEPEYAALTPATDRVEERTEDDQT